MAWAWEVAEARDLDIYQTMVLLRLADHANDQGVCWPGKDNLSVKCRCSKRKVDEVIKELSAMDVMRVEERFSDGGKHSTNRYFLNLDQQHLFRSDNPAQRAGMHSVQGCTAQQGTLHSVQGDPAQCAPEPSFNHQEPRAPRAPAREAAAIDYENWKPDDTCLNRIRRNDPDVTDEFIERERLEFVTYAEDQRIREGLLRSRFIRQVHRNWIHSKQREGNRGPLRKVAVDLRDVPTEQLEAWSLARDGPRANPGESADDYRKRIVDTLTNRGRRADSNPAIAQLAGSLRVN